MKNKLVRSVTEAELGHTNPKYMPQGRYTMRFAGITNNRLKTSHGVIHAVVRVHFFIDTPWHGRRKFYKQYHSFEMRQLAHDLQHYLGELYPSTVKSLKRRIVLINKLKGKYADVRLTTVAHSPRFGLISGVTEYHGYGHFRYQEFLFAQQEAAHGTIAH